MKFLKIKTIGNESYLINLNSVCYFKEVQKRTFITVLGNSSGFFIDLSIKSVETRIESCEEDQTIIDLTYKP